MSRNSTDGLSNVKCLGGIGLYVIGANEARGYSLELLHSAVTEGGEALNLFV